MKFSCFSSFSFLSLRVLIVLATFVSPTFAADVVLATGAGLSIRTEDILADAQRMPLEARKQALTRAENVAQMTSILFQRRILAAEAERAGLASDPQIAAAIQIAKERILSDARLARIDAANTPSPASLDAYAASTYRADSQRFETPEQIRARHILISAGPDARAKAEQLLAKLKAGGSFEVLARENSADRASALKGGDLGFFARGTMVAAFDKEAFTMQPGQLSGPVESEFGFHIIRLEEKRPAGKRPFEEVREELRKEAAGKAIRMGREQEVQRLNAAMSVNEAAIGAFAEAQR